ncbi:helix-turn-helix domain-containing protein [Collinsella bouchesdurhonensis]|uniref:helix-turn-helix domain-containing protein n=1 Tax=Collinsella bouchesdurhonensis TaxID=1907654 RepID=UPI001106BED1|nr:helix-turn-helix transcriptional regulator [Collinsella bouchesdurhonensis]
MSSRFGGMLRERRRSLGLSIQQVANTIKIRPQIIEFFENGDFTSMPPRGYAQGMISSYARYLGLNPRDVVNAYFDELYIFENSDEGRAGSYHEPPALVSTRSNPVSTRFMVVDGSPAPSSSSSRFGQRPPQAGYVSDTTTGHQSLRVGGNSRRRRALPPSNAAGYGERDDYSSDPSVTARIPVNSRSGYRTSHSSRSRGQRSDSRRPTGRNRDPRSLNQRGQGKGAASNGRRGYSSTASSSRSGYGRGQRRGYERRPSSPLEALMSNPRMLMAVLGVAALLIIVLLVSLIRGCTSQSDQPVSSLPAASVDAGSASSASSAKKKVDAADSDSKGSDTDSSGDNASSDSSSDAADDDKTGSASSVVEQKVVKISLAKGKTSWIEVKVDGVSQYADTPVGPYEAEYTPTKSIEITVDNPSDVQVTENGDKVRWDSKTSGVGRVTITVPQTTSPSAATDETTSSGFDDSSSDSDTSN